MGSNLNPVKSGAMSPMNQTAIKNNYIASYHNNINE